MNASLEPSNAQSLSGTFTLFPALPTELRQQIWLAALHQSLNPSVAEVQNDTTISDDLAQYRPANEFIQYERKNRAALYTYKPGLWIPEYIPKEDPDYHPDSHINLPFRYDLLDDGHFDVGKGGVAALVRTCHECRDVIMRSGTLKEYGLELRPAVCDLAYHHGSRNWYELGEIDRIAMDVDEEGEERMRTVWRQMGFDIENVIGDTGGDDGWSTAPERKANEIEEPEGDDLSFTANEGHGYRAALAKMKEYHCHLEREGQKCHCLEHAIQRPADLGAIKVDNHNGAPMVLARKFDPNTDLLFFPACAYPVLMIEKHERGFFSDLIERGISTGGSLDGIKHVAISAKMFRCGIGPVGIVAFAQTFSCLRTLTIVVDGSVNENKSAKGASPVYGVDGLERMVKSHAWRGSECTAAISVNQKRQSEDTFGPPPAQSCMWRRRQRWEIETKAVFPGKLRGDYSYPDNSNELRNDAIADHLYAQRHGISDPGYQPPVWQASHKVERLRDVFEQLQCDLTEEIEEFIMEATQLVYFEVRIARAFLA